jgi:hypothetical protein
MKLKQITSIALLCLFTFAVHSNEPVAQIDGEDVVLPADTVLVSQSAGSDLKGRLLDSGMSFILIQDRDDGIADTVTVFAEEDLKTICGWEKDLTIGIRLRFNSAVTYCSD